METFLYFFLGIVVCRMFQTLFMAGRIALMFNTAEFHALKLLSRAEEHIWQARTMLDIAAEAAEDTEQIKIVRNEINSNHKKWQKETAKSLLEAYGPFKRMAHWDNWSGAMNHFELEALKQKRRRFKNDKQK